MTAFKPGLPRARANLPPVPESLADRLDQNYGSSVDDPLIANLTRMDFGQGTRVDVHNYGATIISWRHKGKELLYVSPLEPFDNKKPIRGGIPIVFPHFGPWEFGPQHGFARISKWKCAYEPFTNMKGDLTAVFTLEDDDQIRCVWGNRFKLRYTITLTEDSLVLGFEVENKGWEPFEFTCLLHTYFAVPDIDHVKVAGLDNTIFIDKLKDGKKGTDEKEHLSITENVDRIYIDTRHVHMLIKGKIDDRIQITKQNFDDTVVWNPWSEKSKDMKDFDDLGYKKMVCIEAGMVETPKRLNRGESYKGILTLKHLHPDRPSVVIEAPPSDEVMPWDSEEAEEARESWTEPKAKEPDIPEET